jgi:hypothetical protein
VASRANENRFTRVAGSFQEPGVSRNSVTAREQQPEVLAGGCYGGATLGLVATARFSSCPLSDMDRAR